VRTLRLVSVLTVLVPCVPALGSEEIRLTNWQAVPHWMPGPNAAVRETGTRSPEKALAAPARDVLAVPTSALSFTGIAPCRVADTRDASFPAGYGPPFLPGGAPRNFTIWGRCGIPSNAQAVSFNFTVVNPVGPGFLLVYPQGGAQPVVSTLNYLAGQIIANAAVVPLGATGAITAIPGVSGFDLIIDVNGFYAPPQGAFAHLIAVGGVAATGTELTGWTNLGTWTPSRFGTGSYGITLPGLRPGCSGTFPTVQLTASLSGFISSFGGSTSCVSGDTTIQVNTTSPTDVATDSAFFFSVYGPSPVASPLTPAINGRNPSTCTFVASTGVETCE